MALGAERRSVYRMVFAAAGRSVAAGMALGLAVWGAVATLIRPLLFGVEPWDAPSLGAVAVLLAIATLLAVFVPAHRAASVNPVDALRAE
jgi:ABC-type antimicrobial peptide transport system permease subunit